MTLSIIKDASLGLASAPIIQKSSDLQQFEKGRIHYVDEVISRIGLITLVKNFYNITLYKNEQRPISKKLALATISTPCILALLKSSYVSHYINSQIVSMITRIEKHIGRLCYMASVINAIALISFGHLIVGYTALTVFALDLITSSILIQTYVPLLNKTRIIFVKYISPFTELITGVVTRSYLTMGFALFGLYSLLFEKHHKRTTETIQKIPTSAIKNLDEFTTFWKDLHQQSTLYFEMHRERVPQIQIPTLDSSKYPQSQILEIFDSIHWREDFENFLWDRVTNIAESDPEKVFRDLDTSLEEKKAYRQKELPRAKEMAKEWLQAVLNETTKQDLVLFKQHICKMLLEHKDLLEENQTKQSHDLFKGFLTLIFGSGGECHVAQDMKITEAYLEIYKATNKTNQSPFLLMLELAYKNITEQAFKDILNPILQEILEVYVQQAESNLSRAQEVFRREWNQRSLSRIHRLASSTFFYLSAKRSVVLYKETKAGLDLNSVHNFTRIAKLLGKPFNIATDTDEVAERTFSKIAMNPKSSGLIKSLNLCIPLTVGKFYWDVQLEKIIPWLSTHFQEQTYFQINDLAQWFHHLLEEFRTDSNTEEIEAMKSDLCKEIPIINGFDLASWQENSKKEWVLAPTPQALLAFAYGINLLKKKDPNTPSFFNHIDQKLCVTENKNFDFTGIEKITQRIPKWFPFFKDIQEKINNPHQRHQIASSVSDSRWRLTRDINKDALFFAQ